MSEDNEVKNDSKKGNSITIQRRVITDQASLEALAARQRKKSEPVTLPSSHRGEQDKSLSMSWTGGQNNKSRRILGVSKSKKI